VNPRWALLVALLTLTACAAHTRAGGSGSAGSPTGGPGAASTGAVRDEPSYRLAIQLSPPQPVHAQAATLGLTVTAHQDLTLSFGTGQRFDFLVFRRGDAGTPAWRWSDGQFFSQIVGTEHLTAGQERVWTASWTPAAAGTYQVKGMLKALHVDMSVECTVTVT
jgi:hypothetical protein